jgi:glutamate carboxypeptidase
VDRLERTVYRSAARTSGEVKVPTLPDAPELASTVHERVTRTLDEVLTDIETLVSLDSPTFDVPLLDATAEAMAGIARRLGLAAELLPGNGNGAYLQATLEGDGEGDVVLICHHDTVFPVGTVAEWGFRVDGDLVYGPGVVDMKGGIVQGLHTMAALKPHSSGYRSVRLLSVPDEEERGGRPLYLQGPHRELGLTLECGRENGDIVTARKAGAWLQLDVKGRAAHAGVDPDAGLNAVVEAAREALRIAELHHSRPGLSVTVTKLNGGVGTNTVPPTAALSVDVRALLERDMDDVIAELTKPQGTEFGVEWHVFARTPAMERTPEVALLASLAVGVAQHLGHPVGEQATGGSSDACWAAAIGNPVLDGLGPVGGRDHTPDEYGVVSSIPPRAGLLAALITHGPAATRTA